MAITPQNNEAFLREVDDELRRDQLVDFWTRWGRWLIAAIVLGLAVLAGVLYWRYHEQQVSGRQGEQFQTALDALAEEKPQAAAAPLADLATSRNDGYRAMAIFTQADILLQKNDLKGAAAKFASVANDASLDKPFRDLALIRQTSAEYDSLKPNVVVDRLRPLAVKGSPWFGSAGEMVAVAYLRMNRRDLAGELFRQIAAEETMPATIRQRAVQMAGVLGIDAVDQGEDTRAK